ncbi:tRNA (5-methylaminomethyl-2-thiouridylate)-methyltransferase [gamma proteobacterium IMCC2047]|nr:tRNA (5-methylaminomethyl-2-thiouridylate)-methyltransferase [gamma proteobacterium IMCC2047]
MDKNKDQSYFLHAVPEQQLAKTFFPIGELEKPRVREIAEQHDLVTHNKKDSTGICFIGERRFRDFLKQYIPAQPGDIVTPDNEVIGKHQGLMYHTIGQRQGLGIGGMQGKDESPWYVADKYLDTNQLLAVQGKNHPALFAPSLLAEGVSWINGSPPAKQFRCTAKIRYRQSDQRCEVVVKDNGHCHVIFDEPQRAVAPGQSVVFYIDEVCLGGGVITEAIKV